MGENKKWYLQSAATRYGAHEAAESSLPAVAATTTYQIVDRAMPLASVEVWYKDRPSLELLGWDGSAAMAALEAPHIRKRREAEAMLAGDGKRQKVTIDLTADSSEDDDDDGATVTEAPAKPAPVTVTIDD